MKRTENFATKRNEEEITGGKRERVMPHMESTIVLFVSPD